MTEINSLTIQNRMWSSWVFRCNSYDSWSDSYQSITAYIKGYVLEGMLWPEIFIMDEI